MRQRTRGGLGMHTGSFGHGQACSLVQCREKPSKGFKGETGMVIYAGMFGVLAWVGGRRPSVLSGRVGEQSGDGGRNQRRS